MSTLVKAPLTYEPTFKYGKYIDCLLQYKWTEFSECGIRCPCSKSNTIHRNKNSFKFQHCKTKNHMKYLDNLNKEPVVNNDELFGDELVAALKEIKQMKIQLVKHHEAYQLEKQRNQSMQSQLKDILVEKEELLSELNQANEFMQLSREKICNLEDKCKKYDKITHEMMTISGYELE